MNLTDLVELVVHGECGVRVRVQDGGAAVASHVHQRVGGVIYGRRM